MKKLKVLIIITLVVTVGYLVKNYSNGSYSLGASDLPYTEDVTKTGEVKEFDMVASETVISVADDLQIPMWTYNGLMPGPELRVKLGDTVKIYFTNNLPQETTIHFHGVRVPNAMDGVPGVTQDPIKPGESFVYEFTPKDAGTYWYHPHVKSSEQVERGLLGTLIVEDPDEPTYDQDNIVVLNDLRLSENGKINPAFNTMHDLMHDGRWGNLITVNGEPDYDLQVKAGERVRLRFVNTSNARVYQLDFGGLDAKGFAVDGILARETFDAQGFELSPGNRIDVDISVPMVSRSRPYAIRDTFTRQTNNLLSLSVVGVSKEVRTFDTPVAASYPEWNISDSYNIEKEYVLDARRAMMMGIEWTIDGKAYPDYDLTSLKKGETSVIRFTNKSSRLHPMHLHGQFFKVLARDGRSVDEPFMRDTVLVKPKETVDITLVPLDKGTWANHCHALEHAEAGMMTLFEVI